jgi:hypothetical protein
MFVHRNAQIIRNILCPALDADLSGMGYQTDRELLSSIVADDRACPCSAFILNTACLRQRWVCFGGTRERMKEGVQGGLFLKLEGV